jgi:acetoin utilization protein AcuB
MNIDSIMIKRVVTVEMDDSLRVIGEIFANVKFHHLLVVEKNKLLGVISDRDLLKTSSPFLNTLSEQTRDVNTLRIMAHQIMSRKLVTVTKKDSVEDAVRLLLRKNVSCLPVISPNGQIEGIVTWKDLIKGYLQGLDDGR